MSSLAKHILQCTESEEFDLGGFTQDQVQLLCTEAFAEPVKLKEMLRFSFIIWNNQNKSKYAADLMKNLTAALRDNGYQDDKGASVDFMCAGSYKYQHDTGKNVKVIHVFPKATQIADAEDEEEEEAAVDVNSLAPEYLCTICSMDSFQKMVQSKTQSWAQRRALLKDLQEMRGRFEELDQKLIRMEPLTDEEQDLYDSTSIDELGEKISWLSALIKEMVDEGELTRDEKAQMLEQVSTKIVEAEAAAKEAAAQEGKKAEKVAEARKKQVATLTARKERIEAVEPITHSLRREAEVRRLLTQIVPLERLEAKSGLRTMGEITRLGELPDMQEELEELLEKCKGWYQTEEEIEDICEGLKKKVTVSKSKKKSSGGGGGWSTASSKKSGGRSGGQKKSSAASSNMFNFLS